MNSVEVLPVILLSVSTMSLCVSIFILHNNLQDIEETVSNKNLTNKDFCAKIESGTELIENNQKEDLIKKTGKKITIIRRTQEQRRDVIRNKEKRRLESKEK